MEPTFFSKLGAFIDGAYRKLVADCAKDKPPKLEEAVAVLGFAQRTAKQLDDDVQRLLARQQDARLLVELAELDKAVEESTERYRRAVDAKNETFRAIDQARPASGHRDDTEAKKRFNEARCVHANASDEADAAWKQLESIRKRRDAMRAEVEGRLKASAAETGDWQDPANFALV